MKKGLIIVLLAATFISPLAVSAQSVTNEQLLTIIQQLMTQVLALMEKLKAMEATQATQTQTLGAIQGQTVPKVVVAEPTPTPIPVEYTAVKDISSANFSSRCLDFTQNNDGVSLLIAELKLTPEISNKVVNLTGHIDVSGNSSGKSTFQVFSNGQQFAIKLNSGRTDLNMPLAGTDFNFWVKDISGALGVKLTIESGIADGVAIQGLPISFDTVGFVRCQ